MFVYTAVQLYAALVLLWSHHLSVKYIRFTLASPQALSHIVAWNQTSSNSSNFKRFCYVGRELLILTTVIVLSVGGLPAVYVCLKLSKPHDNGSILSMIKGLPRYSMSWHLYISDTKVWWPGWRWGASVGSMSPLLLCLTPQLFANLVLPSSSWLSSSSSTLPWL